ncbi:MAG: 1-acyl-sn-glycerol-3-phosphate acyltransferase [Chloroflexi bacterium]|nr:MAG: 1-acyl-sn-glycerol-3-phosphate acyltransferase [Chloroflexota bacterium]
MPEPIRNRPKGHGKRALLWTAIIRQSLIAIAFFKIVRVTVVNQQAVPRRGAVIVASNHISMLDGIFLWGALRRRAVAMAMAELWKWPIVGWMVRQLGFIPVLRGSHSSGKASGIAALDVLSHQGVLIIYPEGRCVSPGDTAPYKGGVAALSLRTGAPIVPVGIVGSNRLMPLARDRVGRRRFYSRQRVRLEFGQPIDPAQYDSVSTLLERVSADVKALSSAL